MRPQTRFDELEGTQPQPPRWKIALRVVAGALLSFGAALAGYVLATGCFSWQGGFPPQFSIDLLCVPHDALIPWIVCAVSGLVTALMHMEMRVLARSRPRLLRAVDDVRTTIFLAVLNGAAFFHAFGGNWRQLLGGTVALGLAILVIRDESRRAGRV